MLRGQVSPWCVRQGGASEAKGIPARWVTWGGFTAHQRWLCLFYFHCSLVQFSSLLKISLFIAEKVREWLPCYCYEVSRVCWMFATWLLLVQVIKFWFLDMVNYFPCIIYIFIKIQYLQNVLKCAQGAACIIKTAGGLIQILEALHIWLL